MPSENQLVALVLAPLELDEQRVHHALGASARKRIRSTDSSCAIRRGPEVRERHDAPLRLDHGDREAREVARLEGAEREALLARAPCPPASRPRPRAARAARRHLLRRDHAEREPSRGKRFGWCACLARAPLERELVQRHARLLAELHGGQTEVRVRVQPLRAHLVEEGTPSKSSHALQELPDQPRRPRRAARPGRPARPRSGPARRTSGTPALVVEDQRLVAQEDEVGQRVRLRRDDRRAARVQLLAVGGRPRAEPAGSGARRRTRAARRSRPRSSGGSAARLIELEAPPQLARVLDVAIGEEAEPGDRHQRADRGDRPPGREARRRERGAPVEVAARGQEREQQRAQQQPPPRSRPP